MFEYANRLSDEGNVCCILFLNDNKLEGYPAPAFVKKSIINRITHRGPNWFKFNDDICIISNKEKDYIDKIIDSEIVFATAVQTAEFVKDHFLKAKKYYLIQGYENWGVDDGYLRRTYNYGFTNIVIAEWLKQIVDMYSHEPAFLLSNPIDVGIYRCLSDQRNRTKNSIALLYHEREKKGVADAMKVLYLLRESIPNLTVEMFGTFQRPKRLPEWIHYSFNASQSETIKIYNSVQCFLCATIEEGFGLTGLEAMACGACLVSTDYKGVKEYAIDGFNALLSPIHDVEGLAMNIKGLFEDEEKRVMLSENGVRSASALSWDAVMKKLNSILCGDKNVR